MSNSRITFHGGVGSVTGANFLLATGDTRILVDCGLEQGSDFAPDVNAEPFAYDPKTIDALFVTHAHADHIGRIPKLVRDGFRGAIYSTVPTKDLAGIMLKDALKIMEEERRRRSLSPLFDQNDIGHSLALWKTVSYGSEINVSDVKAFFRNAGHILGSGLVCFERNGKTLVFTGDIGNVPQPLLDPPDVPENMNFLVMESVYGDRLHEDVGDRSLMLLDCIKETVERKGVLIIPAFSLERTQTMLYEINNFVESGRIAPIPVFLDSPLAISVTEIYRAHRQYLGEAVREQIARGDDVFDFPSLRLTESRGDSDAIASIPSPKIIIAGSGMSHGGRIRMHERRYLEDKNAMLLLVGYQTVGSLGRLLQDGSKRVRIDGEEVRVRAKIRTIRGYSGHADRDALLGFAEKSASTLKKVFVTMGEERASLFLVQRLRDYLDVDAIAPEQGSTFEIDW